MNSKEAIELQTFVVDSAIKCTEVCIKFSLSLDGEQVPLCKAAILDVPVRTYLSNIFIHVSYKLSCQSVYGY